MADIVVPIVLENLIKLATYEANLLGGVKDQVDSLESDLRFIKVFLQKCAEKRNDPFVKELVDQIRDAALESEDVIDTYAARVVRQRRRNLLAKLFHCIGHARALHSVSDQTSSIRKKIDNILTNREKYGIGEADQPSVDNEEAEQSLQRRRRYVEEDDVVGFVNDATTMINQLTNQSNLRRDVLSIHGMGGLGKTTLARKIYKDTRIKDHFGFCAWVSVSQQWQAKSLLLDLLKSFKQRAEEISKQTVQDLQEELREQLEGKRYFIVMDDIWSTQVWEELRVAHPDNSNGSRILITTRDKEIASNASPTPPYELPFLDDNESWELLQKKVFRGGQWLPNLEKPGRELAKSCRGLPLSIVLLGGILANKEKSHTVWSRFIGNVNSHLSEGVSILTLSYNHLPQELKSCFLYIGMFPEDSEIKVRDLIELWIAEGFIQSNRSTSIYGVAEDYLEKLVDRSMIQVARKRLDGGAKTCRIHDLLRDLCIEESRRDKFFEINSNDISVFLNKKSRRVSIQRISESHFDLPSCARSLFFFGDNINPFYIPILEPVWKTKFIRVLYFFGLWKIKIPSQIKELIFLRCFFIRLCQIVDIPTSIWNFRFLETLHLECSITWRLPMGIWSVMKDLRYLYIDGYEGKPFSFSKHPRSLMGEHFLNLRVLSYLVVDQETALVIAKFPNVRKLGLRFEDELEEGEVEKVMASIGRLVSLQSIEIRCIGTPSEKVGTILNLLPSTLTKITFYCRTIRNGTFDHDILKVLAGQPNLLVLKIEMWRQQQPHELRFVAGGFSKLQALELRNLGIKTWEVEKDAMPNLQSLFIFDHQPMLEYLPEELLCRSTLQLVEVDGLMRVPDKLKTMLTDFKIKYPATPCKINIIG